MEDKKKDVMVRIPRHIHTKIKSLAEQEKRSIIATIEIAIDKYIDELSAHQK